MNDFAAGERTTRASTRSSAGPWCLLVLTLALGSCSSAASTQVCTALFAFISAVAVDSAASPVAGLIVTDTIPRTGVTFAVQQENYPAGAVTIFSDAQLPLIRRPGDTVHVTGIAESKAFHASYLIGSDGCHVSKLAGPDTVTVR